ncbi:hypothetical protein BQ8794_50048 [Mesorhizobium prunaredense]|uniref:Uncharacterized protein n=1 Tax=Mesorhizobium prunaredense TaxID=1631249 RepID=A0A1R3VDF9_9HYPH|nr:hypothetical protein BQ8794_50048 [Mesorhizobium prunaredense]
MAAPPGRRKNVTLSDETPRRRTASMAPASRVVRKVSGCLGSRRGAIGDKNQTDLGTRGNLFGRNSTATQRLIIQMRRNNDSRR